MPNPIKLQPAGGTAATAIGKSIGPFSVTGAALISGSTVNTIGTTIKWLPPLQFPAPTQVLGFVPMSACNTGDCRDTKQLQCYLNKVFGQVNSGAGYTNDVNTFLFNNTTGLTYVLALYKNNTQYLNPTNYSGWTWARKTSLNNNTYGINYAMGKIAGYPNYFGYAVNWGNVYNAFGTGIYQVALELITTTYTQATALVNYLPPLTGSMVIKGAFGTYTYPYKIASGATNAQIWAYLANLINGGSGPYTAANSSSSMTVSGENGVKDNGTTITLGIQKVTFAGGVTTTPTSGSCVLNSEPFLLQAWDCMKARGTVKFEATNSGTIGDTNNDGQLFILSGLNWYDSIRVPGFFGDETYKFDELLLEYGKDNTHIFGDMERVRDKKIPMYKFHSNLMPHYIHNRLSAYGLMADTLLVSDYGLNNPNYSLKQRQMIKAGSYEPKWLSKAFFESDMRYQQRSGHVQVDFQAGIQSIIKNNC